MMDLKAIATPPGFGTGKRARDQIAAIVNAYRLGILVLAGECERDAVL